MKHKCSIEGDLDIGLTALLPDLEPWFGPVLSAPNVTIRAARQYATKAYER